MIADEANDHKDANTLNSLNNLNTINNAPLPTSLTTPLPPPNYSSTVRIVEEKPPVDQYDHQVTIKIEQQSASVPVPVFNV